MFASGQLKEGEMYDVYFGHQFIETEKYDAKPTYKKFSGYRPGVAVIGLRIAMATQMFVSIRRTR